MGGTYVYTVSSMVNVVAFLKSYLIIRLYWHFCSWNGNKAVSIGKRNDYSINLVFAIKAELKYRPFAVISLVMFVSIFFFGFVIRAFELPFIDANG
jgi:hypothetical protein